MSALAAVIAFVHTLARGKNMATVTAPGRTKLGRDVPAVRNVVLNCWPYGTFLVRAIN